jgi:hypothetical protein
MRIAGLALAVAAALPVQAVSAQLGGLARRAAERAAERAVDKAVDRSAGGDRASGARPAPQFDDEVLELTAPRIDQVTRGLEAWRAARADADVDGAGRAYDAAQARSLDFATRHTDARSKWQESNDRVESCRRGILDEQRERNDAEMERQLASLRRDPAKMQAISAKNMEWTVRIQALAAKGDTAGAATAALQMQRELAEIGGFTVEVDSSRADARCGRPAPKPAWLVAWEENDAELRALGARVREAESAGEAEAVEASGFTARQFAIARERIESFVHDGRMGFSKAERDALTPRRSRLAAYFPRA